MRGDFGDAGSPPSQDISFVLIALCIALAVLATLVTLTIG